MCSRLGNAATTGARTDEVRCFLCDSTDARRSGPASERLLRQGESERLALASRLAASLPAKCQRLTRGKKVGCVSSRRGEAIHLLLWARFKVKRRDSGSRRKIAV